MDAAGPVFNAGDKLFYDGGSCSPADFQSKAVYVMGARVGRLHDAPLSNSDGAELLAICLALSWKARPFGYILAGWIVAAMVGGALRWRPHTVLTGEKGAGKSWVLEHIIKPALGALHLERDGGTTEAKIRQDLGGNARPVIMDEAESETSKDRVNMEAVLGLARKASTGAAVGNAYGLYYIRSCFMFSAINPRIVQGADLDRNTIIQLVKDRRHDASARFKDLEARVRSLMTDDFADRLLARSFEGLPILLKNIEIFSDVIEAREGSKRFGDQFGTLIACAFSLTSSKEVTREFADDWCGKHDWKWATEDNDQSDPERLVEYILSSRIRYDHNGIMRESLVGALIDKAQNGDMTEQANADAALGQHAIKVQGDRLLIGGPCQAISDMLRETSWGGNYRRTLGDMLGSEKVEKVVFSPMLRVRAVSVPLSAFMGANTLQDEDLPFEDFR
jgi:putative DNA primase/helicase